MAIELHHLNTHGMMEQAGKVLDGVARLKARIAELEQNLSEIQSQKMQLEDDVALLRRNNAELKEAQRWRKFSEEKPTEEMEGEDFIVSNGYYSVVCEWRGYLNNEPFCGDKNCDDVKYWMPLPSAPKEEK